MTTWVAILGSGLVVGFVLALVAVGFTTIYSGTRIVNFANGQLMVAGAYGSWLVATRTGLPPGVGIGAAIATGMLLGVLIDRAVVAPVRKASLLTQVMALVALASVLDGGYGLVFGSEARTLPSFATASAVVPLVGWSGMDVTIILTTGVLILGLVLFLYRTSLGTYIRATADNPTGASLLGIDPRRVAVLAWIIGGGLAGLGGVLILTKLVLIPTIGSTLTFDAFAAVVLGGFGSISGAVVGGIILGLAQALVASTLGAGYEALVSLVVMLAVLSVRPTGLIGERG